jgi:glycosyltransferase involved in cell wall biosynthesis
MTSQSLPFSFSIVLETENLENVDVQALVRSLTALAKQDLPPTAANEVILIDSGDTPQVVLQQLCQQYSWIQVHSAPSGTTYYQAKMLGAELATGEVIVYYDSDCYYDSSWLHTLLTSFAERDEIQVVAGETTTGGTGIYGVAMALVYIFPQFSGETSITPTTQYFLNNVAFRRSFLLQDPIPTDLPLYRGNCVIHAHKLQQQGYQVWRQPQARAIHLPPQSFNHFFWRFLLIGQDYYWQQQLFTQQISQQSTPTGTPENLSILTDRFSKIFKQHPGRLLRLPLALPIVLAAVSLILIGYIITALKPTFLLKTVSQSDLAV